MPCLSECLGLICWGHMPCARIPQLDRQNGVWRDTAMMWMMWYIGAIRWPWSGEPIDLGSGSSLESAAGMLSAEERSAPKVREGGIPG